MGNEERNLLLELAIGNEELVRKFSGKYLVAARKEAGLTQQSLAAAAGVSIALIQKLETGSYPSERLRNSTLEKIQGAILEAKRRKEVGQAEWSTEVAIARRAGRVRGDKSGGIPLINRAPAGEPMDFTDKCHPPGVADDYIERGDISDDLAFAFTVFGDSMEPEYRFGDVCVCTGARHPQSGDDCYVRFSAGAKKHAGECTFKRVGFTDGAVILRPLNSNYEAEVVPREDIENMAPVIELRRKMKR